MTDQQQVGRLAMRQEVGGADPAPEHERAGRGLTMNKIINKTSGLLASLCLLGVVLVIASKIIVVFIEVFIKTSFLMKTVFLILVLLTVFYAIYLSTRGGN